MLIKWQWHPVDTIDEEEQMQERFNVSQWVRNTTSIEFVVHALHYTRCRFDKNSELLKAMAGEFMTKLTLE